MRKILVPTDFSDNAMNALKYALELFKYEISEFFIMHAYAETIYSDKVLQTLDNVTEATKIVAERAQSQLEETLKKVNKISPNPRHKYMIRKANNLFISEMEKIVDAENIDLVIMGTRGETNDRKITFGSHTLQVLKFVRCPVMAIPEGYAHIQPRRILFVTNYLVQYKRRELKLLCEMAHPYRAQIDVLYLSKSKELSPVQEDNQAFLKAELCKNTLDFKTVYSKNINEAIYTHIKENSTDLLVMVNTKHSFSENIIFQSVIDKISLHITIPFLVLQNIKR